MKIEIVNVDEDTFEVCNYDEEPNFLTEAHLMWYRDSQGRRVKQVTLQLTDMEGEFEDGEGEDTEASDDCCTFSTVESPGDCCTQEQRPCGFRDDRGNRRADF